MGKKLYIGNLGTEMSDGDLSQLFASHGTVQSARVVLDRDTGLPRGFGFVEMGTDQEALAAIAGLNGQDSGGRPLTVREARLRPEGSRGKNGPRGN
jgi:RNA recognition motif-containing protein